MPVVSPSYAQVQTRLKVSYELLLLVVVVLNGAYFKNLDIFFFLSF